MWAGRVRPMTRKTRWILGALAVLVSLSLAGLLALSVLFMTRSERAPASPPSTSVSVVDEAVRGLHWGSVAFGAPPTMQYRTPVIAELLLSPSLPVAELEAQLRASAPADSARIQISNRMEAQLTGEGFSVRTLTPDLQAVRSAEPTRWRWEVVPTEHGIRSLHVTLSATLNINGSDAPIVVRTYDRDVKITITVSQRLSSFIQANWQWLWAAVLVPVGGYLWNLRRKRQGSAA
jgi:hypothetical protein